MKIKLSSTFLSGVFVVIIIVFTIPQQVIGSKTALEVMDGSQNSTAKNTTTMLTPTPEIKRNIGVSRIQAPPEVTSSSSRSYSAYSGTAGGGGYSSGYSNSGSLMYYSNFDTALTTLAFLSFGVFLLNMIFSFLDFGTPLGPINVAKDAQEDGIIKVERRSTGSTPPATMSPGALLALSAIQQTLLDTSKKSNIGVIDDNDIDDNRPECAFRFLMCDNNERPELRGRLDDMFSALTSFILTGKLRTNKKLWATSRLHELFTKMENGGCDELTRMCPELS